VRDEHTSPSGLGLHVVGVDTAGLRAGQLLDFTYKEEGAAGWAGQDFRILVVARV
jgi:hypothetical protein